MNTIWLRDKRFGYVLVVKFSFLVTIWVRPNRSREQFSYVQFGYDLVTKRLKIVRGVAKTLFGSLFGYAHLTQAQPNHLVTSSRVCLRQPCEIRSLEPPIIDPPPFY